jgi:hypothetical protein
MRANVWLGPAAAASATQVIAPVMRDNRAKVEALLREVLLLQAVVTADGDCGGALEQLLPRRLKQYQKGESSVASLLCLRADAISLLQASHRRRSIEICLVALHNLTANRCQST